MRRRELAAGALAALVPSQARADHLGAEERFDLYSALIVGAKDHDTQRALLVAAYGDRTVSFRAFRELLVDVRRNPKASECASGCARPSSMERTQSIEVDKTLENFEAHIAKLTTQELRAERAFWLEHKNNTKVKPVADVLEYRVQLIDAKLSEASGA